ncbi:PH domain-containing protein [Actinomyces qiguomingii]|uniref:PH domain-containing protein n=1 Tax=Actinomyces qiguomingii TaxID=2057800 RepID=UPI001304E94A|nr:PH domain-containing protein [Actinomyces qiguomingii]
MPTIVVSRRVLAPDPQVHAILVQGIARIQDCTIVDAGRPIRVERKRNMLRNRWAMAAEVSVEQGVVTIHVDGAGSNQRAFSQEIFALLPEGIVDDQGLADATAHMHKSERFFSKAELRTLQDDLRPDERVKMLVSCALDGSVGLLVLTDKRLLLKDRTLGAQATREINPRQITSISAGRWLGNETMEFTVSGSAIKVSNLSSGRAEELARAIREVQAAADQPVQIVQQLAQPVDASPVEQLNGLAQLHASGVLTDEEFAAKKAEILARM